MQKAIKSVSVVFSLVCALVFGFVGYGAAYLPESFVTTDARYADTGNLLFTCECDEVVSAVDNDFARSYPAEIKLWGTIPVKNSTVTVVHRRYVTLGGNVFGLRIFADGVIVAGVGTLASGGTTVAPAKKAGIKQGDVIKEINGTTVTSNHDVSRTIEESNGAKLSVKLVRDGKTKTVEVVPAKDTADGKYKLGMWVRDSSAGVGTITFVDNNTGTVAGLGHAICDADTGDIIPIKNGDMLNVSIRGCVKGTSGTPGELCGVFGNKKLGELYVNGSDGVYGVITEKDSTAKKIPVALSSEVETGKAQIVSTVNGNGPEYFDIEITKIHRSDDGEKNMVINVTDEDLIKKTGRIVQGMSGSPIVQNGMLVGAVTHVFVNDPQQGYAIFAETMIETAENLESELADKAA